VVGRVLVQILRISVRHGRAPLPIFREVYPG
jgi:hypothetical protein